MIDNQQKYLNYKEQFRRLNRAISNGYNLEAMFITYFIIEDRTKAILIHMGKYESYLKSINTNLLCIQRLRISKKTLKTTNY